MSLLAILRKYGETIASYDVPNHANILPSLRESVRILQQEINHTLTSLVEGEATDGIASNDDDMDEDSEDGEAISVNGNKRQCAADSATNKKLKTS